MDYSFTTIGALVGMAIAIILIIKKFHPAYSLIVGALIGGLIGSGGNEFDNYHDDRWGKEYDDFGSSHYDFRNACWSIN